MAGIAGLYNAELFTDYYSHIYDTREIYAHG
jgi:hypothetical protein